MNTENVKKSENTSIFDSHALAQLGNFRLRVAQLATGMTFGEHNSVRSGISTEFQDHRPWETGNDPKLIDWRVFARSGKLFQRRYREEANTAFYFLLDYSPSMDFAGISGEDGTSSKKRLSKREYAQCTAAVLAYVALQQRDLVSFTALNGSSTVSLRLSTGENHWVDSLDFLEKPPFPPMKKKSETEKTARFSEVLNHLASHCTRRGKIFIFSDLFDVETWGEIVPQLKLLLAKKHEIVLFHVLDADEWEFPYDSRTQFVSLENPSESLTSMPTEIRTEYLNAIQDWQKNISEGAQTLGIQYIRIDTRTPISETIRIS
ncbi:MAG: DUF58 domain-containing protein [Planctomycetia bacterium]|nr:DUF58 domain-containing protein [Planctomycetia bacterium]